MDGTVVRATAIAVCGLTGALLGWMLILLLEWNGAGGAFAAAAIGMTVATLMFAGCVALSNALAHRREP